MPLSTVELQHSVFVRTKAQVQVEAQSSITLNHELPGLVPHLSALLSCSSPDIWVSRCSTLHIRIKVVFGRHSLPNDLDMARIREMMTRSLDAAELWTQLGLEVHSNQPECFSSHHESSFSLHFLLGDPSSATAGCKNVPSSTANIRPPTTVESCQISAINILLNFSYIDAAESYKMMSATDNISPEQPVPLIHPELIRPLEGEDVNEADKQIAHIDDRGPNKSRYRPPSHRVMLSLCDAALRNVFCSRPRATRGVQHIVNKRVLDLPQLAPAIFMPGHAEKLECRASLIDPIARYLVLYQKSRTSDASETPSIYDGEHSSNKWPTFPHDADDDEDIVAGNLWITMTKVLAEQGPNQRLRPVIPRQNSMVCDNDQQPNEANMLARQQEEQEDDSLLFEEGSEGEDESLLDIYDTYAGQILQKLRGEKSTSRPTLHRPEFSGHEVLIRRNSSASVDTFHDELQLQDLSMTEDYTIRSDSGSRTDMLSTASLCSSPMLLHDSYPTDRDITPLLEDFQSLRHEITNLGCFDRPLEQQSLCSEKWTGVCQSYVGGPHGRSDLERFEMQLLQTLDEEYSMADVGKQTDHVDFEGLLLFCDSPDNPFADNFMLEDPRTTCILLNAMTDPEDL